MMEDSVAIDLSASKIGHKGNDDTESMANTTAPTTPMTGPGSSPPSTPMIGPACLALIEEISDNHRACPEGAQRYRDRNGAIRYAPVKELTTVSTKMRSSYVDAQEDQPIRGHYPRMDQPIQGY